MNSSSSVSETSTQPLQRGLSFFCVTFLMATLFLSGNSLLSAARPSRPRLGNNGVLAEFFLGAHLSTFKAVVSLQSGQSQKPSGVFVRPMHLKWYQLTAQLRLQHSNQSPGLLVPQMQRKFASTSISMSSSFSFASFSNSRPS